MPDIPAVCPNGHLYPSGIFVGDGSTGIEVVGGLSQCPICGQMGAIEEGSFSVRGGVLTRTTIAAMARNVAALTDDEITELRALLERSNQDPHLAETLVESGGAWRRLGEILSSPTSIALATWAAVLVAVVLFVIEQRQAGGGPQITPEQLDELIDAIKAL